MPAIIDTIPKPGENRETGWVNRLFNREGYTPEYQELKFTLHRKLLDRINLEALSSMAGDRVRAEIRAAVAKLVEEERTPLSLVEKDRVIEEILDEVFGLGPLEPLLQDPSVSDILTLEIQKTFDFFRATASGENIQRIVVAGGTARVPGLVDLLREEFAMPVEELNPFRKVLVNPGKHSDDTIREMAPRLAIAVGLALRSFD